MEYSIAGNHQATLTATVPPLCGSDSLFSATANIYVNSNVDNVVKPAMLDEAIGASPNPTDGIITFHAPDFIGELQVVNVAGMTIIDLGNVASRDVAVDVHGLPPGIYYSIIHSSAGTKALKFVVR